MTLSRQLCHSLWHNCGLADIASHRLVREIMPFYELRVREVSLAEKSRFSRRHLLKNPLVHSRKKKEGEQCGTK